LLGGDDVDSDDANWAGVQPVVADWTVDTGNPAV
jgi:hypothetical protein